MIYICEKCNMVFNADHTLEECEACGCTYIRRADENEVMDIVGSMLLGGNDGVLLTENEKGVKYHR